jgi:AcrR family transcriptional regulator
VSAGRPPAAAVSARRPRGRRPGGEDTRAAIVDGARAEFAERGYDGASLRGVARRAGVDPRLVHHYFAGKPALFAEALSLPVDPAAVVERVLAGPREEVGVRVARAFLELFDNPPGRDRIATLLGAVTGSTEASRMVREFLVSAVYGEIARRCAPPEALRRGPGALARRRELELRAGLAAGQMVGLAVLRYVVAQPAVADATPEALAAHVGPVLQAYLVGPLPGYEGEA